jgi:hypothetical protein
MGIKTEPKPILKPVVVDDKTRERLAPLQQQLSDLERTSHAEVKAEGKHTIEVQGQLDRLDREISRIPGFNRMSAAEQAAASTHVPGAAWLLELRHKLQGLVDESSTRSKEAGNRAEAAWWVAVGAEGQQLVTDAGVNPAALWGIAERLPDLEKAGGAAGELGREVGPAIDVAKAAIADTCREFVRGQAEADTILHGDLLTGRGLAASLRNLAQIFVGEAGPDHPNPMSAEARKLGDGVDRARYVAFRLNLWATCLDGKRPDEPGQPAPKWVSGGAASNLRAEQNRPLRQALELLGTLDRLFGSRSVPDDAPAT